CPPGRRHGSSARPGPGTRRSSLRRRCPRGWRSSWLLLRLFLRGRAVLRRGASPLGGDEAVEPAHLALDLLEPEAPQLQRIFVEPRTRVRRGLAVRLEALGQPGAPALEHAEAGLGVGLREARAPHVEVVVLPGGRAGAGQDRLEVLLALVGQLVDDAAPSEGLRLGGASGDPWLRLARRRRRLALRRGDEAAGDQALQGRVERAVREG